MPHGLSCWKKWFFRFFPVFYGPGILKKMVTVFFPFFTAGRFFLVCYPFSIRFLPVFFWDRFFPVFFWDRFLPVFNRFLPVFNRLFTRFLQILYKTPFSIHFQYVFNTFSIRLNPVCYPLFTCFLSVFYPFSSRFLPVFIDPFFPRFFFGTPFFSRFFKKMLWKRTPFFIRFLKKMDPFFSRFL